MNLDSYSTLLECGKNFIFESEMIALSSLEKYMYIEILK